MKSIHEQTNDRTNERPNKRTTIGIQQILIKTQFRCELNLPISQHPDGNIRTKNTIYFQYVNIYAHAGHNSIECNAMESIYLRLNIIDKYHGNINKLRIAGAWSNYSCSWFDLNLHFQNIIAFDVHWFGMSTFVIDLQWFCSSFALGEYTEISSWSSNMLTWFRIFKHSRLYGK